MIQLTLVQLKAYQARTFCLNPELLLKTPQDAIRFVNERGFVFFWPVKGFTFPSLWAAVAGDRPVPDDHDDPANITWSWKETCSTSTSGITDGYSSTRMPLFPTTCCPPFTPSRQITDLLKMTSRKTIDWDTSRWNPN